MAASCGRLFPSRRENTSHGNARPLGGYLTAFLKHSTNHDVSWKTRRVKNYPVVPTNRTHTLTRRKIQQPAQPILLLFTQGTRRSRLRPARLEAILNFPLTEDASRAARQVRNRTFQAGVAVALSAGEHAAARGAGLVAPAAGGAAGGGFAGSEAVPPGAVEALLISAGTRDAELQPLQEGNHACVFRG